MPGLVIDPEQNPNEEKQHGIVHIYGVLATYDKEEFEDSSKNKYMRFKPAGWLIDKNKVGIELRDAPYIWREVVPVIYKIVAKSGVKIDKALDEQGDLVKELFNDLGGDNGIKDKMKKAKIKPYKPF